MHTFRSEGATFNHNYDMSGDVIIFAADGSKVEISAKAVIEFVAEHVRRQTIAKLEVASSAELLGL